MNEMIFWNTWEDLVIEAIYEVLDNPLYVEAGPFVFWPPEIEYMERDPSRRREWVRKLDEERARWSLDIGVRKVNPSGPMSSGGRKRKRTQISASGSGRCVVHGCGRPATQQVELISQGTVAAACDEHAAVLVVLDSEVLLERWEIRRYGRPDCSSLGRIVPDSEVFPEFDDGEDVPASQAAMAVYTAAYLQQYEMPDEIIEVSVIDKSAWASDPLFKEVLPYIAGEIDLEYIDPRWVVDSDLAWLFWDDFEILGSYELPEVENILRDIARAKKGDVV